MIRPKLERAPKKTQLFCAFVVEGSKKVMGMEEFEEPVEQTLKDMGGSLGRLAIVPGVGPAKRLLFAGLGKREDITNDTIRHVSGLVAQKARELKLDEYSIIVPSSSIYDQVSSIEQIVEGTNMALYKFDKFKGEREKNFPKLSIVTKLAGASGIIRKAHAISEGVILAKSIANMPPNQCNPTTLGEYAKDIARTGKMRCRILSKQELQKKGFGGIIAVGQGSENEPKMIILEYSGTTSSKRPVVLVGKAVTFDTGGISLKPGEKMDEMKFDKCGGCTVLGIMNAISSMKLHVNVIGIIPSVENMPDGKSYRPGDIIKLYSGKTAEIINTDAEGRLILADALTYGEEHYTPKAIIDFATLTGACIVALGTNVAGMISNNDALSTKIIQSSQRTAEEIWRLPLNQDYMNMIKSDVADMKNMGSGRAAGTIAAAAFLRNAIKDTPWVHLDIAGVAWTQSSTKEKSYNPKGATGFGVRLVMDYLQS